MIFPHPHWQGGFPSQPHLMHRMVVSSSGVPLTHGNQTSINQLVGSRKIPTHWFYHDFTMVLPWFCHGKAMVISRTPLILSVASSMCHPQWRCSRMVSLIWVWKNGGYDEIWWVHTCYSLSLNVMSYWWCLYFCMLHLQNYNLKWKKDDEVWNLEAAYIHSKPFECFLNWLSSKALVSV